MPRTRRLIINDETAVYHVMSRTALDGFPLGDVEPQLNSLRPREIRATKISQGRLVFCEELNRVKKILCWI
jgi:hypothetical protein